MFYLWELRDPTEGVPPSAHSWVRPDHVSTSECDNVDRKGVPSRRRQHDSSPDVGSSLGGLNGCGVT